MIQKRFAFLLAVLLCAGSANRAFAVKPIFITGVNRGLGLHLCRIAARNNLPIIVSSRRESDTVECALFLGSWQALQVAAPRTDWNALELFAGPAYHAGVLTGWTVGCQVYAVDQSAAMRDLAIRDRGLPPFRYVLGALPQVLQQAPWKKEGLAFDLVLAPRFSLGLLSPREVERLLVNLQPSLRDHALIVFELHAPASLLGDFVGEELKTRRAVFQGETWTCQWPCEPIHWDGRTTQVRMKIELRNERGEGIFTDSEEWVHSLQDLDALCEKLGGYELLFQSRGSLAINRNAHFGFIRRTH